MKDIKIQCDECKVFIENFHECYFKGFFDQYQNYNIEEVICNNCIKCIGAGEKKK